ncbi:1-deoxy-D-xylulose-5-phosphate reductoisomerase [Pseudothioglobus sp. nBUS_23]|uniref:1-deoxy-D-xylulose-5-phosphate reductoisomerase n=1 Tax=Pseudothioglobus sp. nBUS_23 TaxID=3395318 RepID=UPI003EBA4AAF
MKNITILGATGSIGLNTLDVVSRHPDQFSVFAVSANSDWKSLIQICKDYQPSFAVLSDEASAEKLRAVVSPGVQVLCGEDSLDEIAAHPNTDFVMAAIVGGAGMSSTFSAAKAGKRIMLANKESLILGGNLLMGLVKNSGAEIIPVDSEHSAIFQCLKGGSDGLSKIQLTASGGPFLKTSFENLKSATPEQACNHPNWKMGKKISVDSATMMNKGLEIIEASFLFGLSASQIEVVIHPQSIVHSFVYFDDGSVLSQLGLPDMRSAIAYALSHPGRIKSGVKALDLTQQESLEFHQPDLKKYKCLELAYLALEQGKSAPGTLNAANEVAVNAFLKNKIGFLNIPEIVEKTLQEVSCQNLDTLESVVENDQLSRKIAQSFVKSSD